MSRTEKEKMLAGELYRGDPEIMADLRRANGWLKRYNFASDAEAGERLAMMRELLGAVGDGTVVRSPFQCDLGYNIHLGREVFLNVNCVILDIARVTIGDLTRIGPGVQINTPDHPRDPALRRQRLESAHPITIGENVWIGGGAIILPGISIGDDAIVGAGSIVTRDVAPGAIVAGNPARPLSRREAALIVPT